MFDSGRTGWGIQNWSRWEPCEEAWSQARVEPSIKQWSQFYPADNSGEPETCMRWPSFEIMCAIYAQKFWSDQNEQFLSKKQRPHNGPQYSGGTCCKWVFAGNRCSKNMHYLTKLLVGISKQERVRTHFALFHVWSSATGLSLQTSASIVPVPGKLIHICYWNLLEKKAKM